MAAQPQRTPGAVGLALVSFLTAPLGLLILLLLKWPWTWKVSVVALWAFLVGSAQYGLVRVLLGIALVIFAAAMLVSRERWARAVGAVSIALFTATVAGAWMPPASALTVHRLAGSNAGTQCVAVYAEQQTLLASLPLHGAACYDGSAVTYEWEDCGGASTFTVVSQTCRHRHLADGSLEMTTSYTIAPWIAPWLSRSGSHSFTVRPNGTVTT